MILCVGIDLNSGSYVAATIKSCPFQQKDIL